MSGYDTCSYAMPDGRAFLLYNSTLLKSEGAIFEPSTERTWHLIFQGKKYIVTFYPEVFDAKPSVRFMNFGDPLFEQLLQLTLLI